MIKHGFNRRGKRAPEYRSWVCLRARCYDPKNNEFHRYGARGITVCERWRNSFIAFIADMGIKPTPRYSIDRIDSNGNYEPSNCRWANHKTQHRNARSNKIVSAFGRSQCLAAWTDECGLNYKMVQLRLARGWDAEKAITEPSRRKKAVA